jgi:hypothetical protein
VSFAIKSITIAFVCRRGGVKLAGAIGRRTAEFRLARLELLRLIGRGAGIGTGEVIENLFRKFSDLFLSYYFLKHRVLENLLLNQIGKLERSHLQHLDALPQLRR